MASMGDPEATLQIRRLTPLDIHNKEFKKGFRGYDESEVDEFLDLIVAEFERLVRQNDELQATISGLESRLEHYKGLEETLKNSIVLAQKTADETRECAHRKLPSSRGKPWPRRPGSGKTPRRISGGAIGKPSW